MQNNINEMFVIFLIAFILGSLPFGLWMGRVFGKKDIRLEGSGNIGATNVSRLLGVWPAGFLTLFLDCLKGLTATLMGTPWGYEWVQKWFALEAFPVYMPWACALFAVLGHCYSPWLKFKGGKGVATALGSLLILNPLVASVGILVFMTVFYLKRLGSLASLFSLLVVFVLHLITKEVDFSLWFFGIMGFVILLRHEKNIYDLLDDKERSFQKNSL